MITTPIKKNYLNNKDILKEIHKSKNTFCSFTGSTDHQYDFIVDINDNDDLEKSLAYASKLEIIQQAKENRAHRITQELLAEKKIEKGDKIDPDSVSITDLVFRVMTWEHIPLSPKPLKKSSKISKKSAQEIFEIDSDLDDILDLSDIGDLLIPPDIDLDNMIHVRLNFPPFQHYKIDDFGSFVCVGKSHWVDDVNTGSFSKDHGQVTNNLANMYLKLCEKYSLRYNWRGYTYVDEMRGAAILQLTYVGLRFNEAKSQNPFAYYTAAITNSFCRVLNTEKRVQNIRDDILEINGLSPSFTRQHNHDLTNEMKRNQS